MACKADHADIKINFIWEGKQIMAEGHRKRVSQRFTEENIDTIPDYVVLEKLLHGVIQRKDTCGIARELIRQFGGIPQVVDASVTELMKVPGIGETAANFIKFVPLFYRRYATDKYDKPLLFNAPDIATKYMIEKFIGYEAETLMVLCMDSSCRMIVCRPISEGNTESVEINVRKILKFALSFDSARIIIAHNHICGNAIPSQDDIIATERILKSLREVGIMLDDHIIVSGGDCISMRQSGYLDIIE